MAPRYFQGKTLYGATPVEASSAVTFRDVVDKMRLCPTIPLRRQDFFALTKAERDDRKKVPYFVAACFKTSPSPRRYDRATVCNLVFLDIDDLPDGSSPAKPFYDDPDLLYSALGSLNFAAYATASSTPEKPRMRIVIDAEAIPVSLYARAVATIGGYLGITTNSESKVCVQAMFLPTMFQDSTQGEHPLIAHRLDGITFGVRDISEDLIPDKETETARTDYGTDALDYLRAPVPEITLAIAKEALEHVDPDIGRKEWLEMAAALKHQFHPKLADEAYQIFEDWSSAGEKFAGSDDTGKMWDSLRPTPIGRVPVTIRSLLRVAASSGWDDNKVKESCFKGIMRWMETATSAELMDKGIDKILALPLVTPIQEDVLISELCKQAKRRFEITISTTACRKDVVRKKALEKSQEKPSEKKLKAVWANNVCYVAAAGEFCRQNTGERYKKESFDASYSRWLLPTEESLKNSGVPINPATLSQPTVKPSEYALNHLKISTVYDYDYDPAQPAEIIFVNRGIKYVNRYTPTYPPLNKDGSEAAGAVFQKHLSNLILEPEYRKIITDFMAFLVQSPGRKIRWAPLIQSTEGAGKTYLAKVGEAVLGCEHVKTISDTAFNSGWNEWAFGSQLVVVSEVYVAGENRHKIMNTIKPLITDDPIPLYERFRNARNVRNNVNYILCSNHHNALTLTPNNRRYFIIKSPLQNKSQLAELGENYFNELFDALRDNAGGLRAYFMDWEISPEFNPDGNAPASVYMQEMVADSASELTAAVRRLMLEGDFPLVQYDIVSAKALLDCLMLEGVRVSSQALAQVLREEGFSQIGRHLFGTERQYIWIRNGVVESTAIAKAVDRFKNGKIHLCMELAF